FERRAAVGLSRVHVQIAPNIGLLDQLRQPSFERGFDLARIFPKLRRNPGEAELLVNRLFTLRRHSLVIVKPEQPVLIQRQAELLRACTQRDVVFLAPSEILQRRAITLARKRAKIHLQSFEAELDARFVRAFSKNLTDARMLREAF